MDRMPSCDRCCADYVVRFWHAETKSELRLCAHHTREHEPALLDHGWVACMAVADLPPLTADPSTH